jgi:hypothetical protein
LLLRSLVGSLCHLLESFIKTLKTSSVVSELLTQNNFQYTWLRYSLLPSSRYQQQASRQNNELICLHQNLFKGAAESSCGSRQVLTLLRLP